MIPNVKSPTPLLLSTPPSCHSTCPSSSPFSCTCRSMWFFVSVENGSTLNGAARRQTLMLSPLSRWYAPCETVAIGKIPSTHHWTRHGVSVVLKKELPSFCKIWGAAFSVKYRIPEVMPGPAGHCWKYSDPKIFTRPWNQYYVTVLLDLFNAWLWLLTDGHLSRDTDEKYWWFYL